jgi:hypothetical protein
VFEWVVLEDDGESAPATLLIRQRLALNLPDFVILLLYLDLHHLMPLDQLVDNLPVLLLVFLLFPLVLLHYIALSIPELIFKLLSQLFSIA